MAAVSLARHDNRVLALSALGGALEFYDFVIFVFFTTTLAQLFFPPDMPAWLGQLQTYAIFAAGYLVRPLGGLVMAHYGDRLGRKRMFTLSITLMALPTLLIGMLPTYAQVGVAAPVLLLALRMLQGVAVGGEMPGAWVFVAEHVPPRRVAFAAASLCSGMSVGILLGSLTALWLHGRFAPEQVLAGAWRLPFVVGGVFGFVSVWLRHWLEETPVFLQMQAERQQLEELPFKRVVREHPGAVGLSMLATWGLTAAIVVVILMTPTVAQQAFALEAGLATRGNVLASLGLIVGCLVAGAMADRIGRPRALVLWSLALAAAMYALYLDLATGGRHFLPLYALAGFTAGVAGIAPGVIVTAFPPAVRYTGVALAYNLAYAVAGAVTPPLIAYLALRAGHLAPAHYVAAVALANIGLALFLMRRAACRG